MNDYIWPSAYTTTGTDAYHTYHLYMCVSQRRWLWNLERRSRYPFKPMLTWLRERIGTRLVEWNAFRVEQSSRDS